jgi:hypothetical protein
MKILCGISATVFEVAAKHAQDAQVEKAALCDQSTVLGMKMFRQPSVLLVGCAFHARGSA